MNEQGTRGTDAAARAPPSAAGRALRLVPATPRSVALRMLAHRFGTPAGGAEPAAPPAFDLAAFQRDAADRARDILRRRGGVLIADGVGLGKTYVALALIEDALAARDPVLVTTPASLRTAWAPLVRTVAARHGAAVHGLGGHGPRGRPAARARRRAREGTRDRPTERASGRIAWTSHTKLSRGAYDPGRAAPPRWVVVDEAHAFRNPRTRRYRALARLCVGARVVLVTATPVNNTLLDLHALLRLFAANDAFRDLGVGDLERTVLDALAGRPGAAGALLRVLRAVAIRRSRAFVRGHYGDAAVPSEPGGSDRRGAPARFPRREPPVPIRYSLEDAYPGLYGAIAETLERLTLAPFRLAAYGAAHERGPGASHAELLRLMLLKRLESSAVAFRLSIARQLRFLEAFLAALESGRLLRSREHRALYDTGEEDAVQLVLERVALATLPPGTRAAELARDAAADLALLGRLAAGLKAVDPAADPKLRRLRTLLDEELAGRKAVIFTESRDTARHLWRALVGRGRVALVDGGGAWLGRAPCGRRAAIERFAPAANGVRRVADRERADLLIATDVLAEGLNLQDAGDVVSYDLPWNPMRLVQRVGRVDRLGSPHEAVRGFAFLPDGGLEVMLGLVGRLRSKLAQVGGTFGLEGPVLQPGDDAPAPALGGFLDRLAAGDPRLLDDVEREAARPFETEERLRVLLADARRSGEPEAFVGAAANRAQGAPFAEPFADPLAVPVATVRLGAGEAPAVLVIAARGGTAAWRLYEPASGRVLADDDRAAELLAAAARPQGAPPGPSPRPGPILVATPKALNAGIPAVETPAAELPVRQPASSELAVAERALAAVLDDIAAAARCGYGFDALPARAGEAAAARRLLAAMTAVQGGPDPSLCARADRVLERLSRPNEAGVQLALANALAGAAAEPVGPPAAALERLLAGLEEALGVPDRGRAGLGPEASAPRPRPADGIVPPARIIGVIVGVPGRPVADPAPAGRGARAASDPTRRGPRATGAPSVDDPLDRG